MTDDLTPRKSFEALERSHEAKVWVADDVCAQQFESAVFGATRRRFGRRAPGALFDQPEVCKEGSRHKDGPVGAGLQEVLTAFHHQCCTRAMAGLPVAPMLDHGAA